MYSTELQTAACFLIILDILTLLEIDIYLSYLLYPGYVIESHISISDESHSRNVLFYYCHWVDSSHSGLLVTDGSIHPVVSG